MESTIELSLEQELRLRIIGDKVQYLSLKEAQDYLLEMLRQSMVKDNFFNHILRNKF